MAVLDLVPHRPSVDRRVPALAPDRVSVLAKAPGMAAVRARVHVGSIPVVRAAKDKVPVLSSLAGVQVRAPKVAITARILAEAMKVARTMIVARMVAIVVRKGSVPSLMARHQSIAHVVREKAAARDQKVRPEADPSAKA